MAMFSTVRNRFGAALFKSSKCVHFSPSYIVTLPNCARAKCLILDTTYYFAQQPISIYTTGFIGLSNHFRINRLGLQCRKLYFTGAKFIRSSSNASLSTNSTNTNYTDTTVKSESDSKKEKSKWTGKNIYKIGLIFLGIYMTTVCVGFVVLYGAPKLDDDGKEILDEYSDQGYLLAYLKRALQEANIYKQMIQDPSSEKLLPDPLEEPYYQPPYTLVLEMTGVLVHPDWTYGTGWRFKKRPGVDAFLRAIGPPMFEVVVYTSEQAFTAFPLLDNLDSEGNVMYRLFRDATRYIGGHHVKDLSCLNRDLSKVIFVDWNPKSYSLQPRNAVRVEKWTGNDEDRTLVDLAAFLKMFAVNGVADVRTVLDYYNQFPDPIVAYRENLRRFQEEQQQKLQAEQKKPPSLISPPWSAKRL